MSCRYLGKTRPCDRSGVRCHGEYVNRPRSIPRRHGLISLMAAATCSIRRTSRCARETRRRRHPRTPRSSSSFRLPFSGLPAGRIRFSQHAMPFGVNAGPGWSCVPSTVSRARCSRSKPGRGSQDEIPSARRTASSGPRVFAGQTFSRADESASFTTASTCSSSRSSTSDAVRRRNSRGNRVVHGLYKNRQPVECGDTRADRRGRGRDRCRAWADP